MTEQEKKATEIQEGLKHVWGEGAVAQGFSEKQREYAQRIVAGESPDDVLQGLPSTFRQKVMEIVNNESSEDAFADNEFVSLFPSEENESEIYVGEENITPTARLIGETDDVNATQRGWMSALVSAFNREDVTPEKKQQNLQAIVTGAKEAGVPKTMIADQLAKLGIGVRTQE